MTVLDLGETAVLPLRYINRHGLITGRTGSGKSVTLMRIVEQLSLKGVCSFVVDAKGDLSALQRTCPTTTLDLYGQYGNPISVPLNAMGATLVARALELTDAQTGVVEAAFAMPGPMATPADLRRKLAKLASGSDYAHRNDHVSLYGKITASSLGVVARALSRLDAQAGPFFNGRPWDVKDLIDETNVQPIGKVAILAADRLMQAPRLYGAFLLWLLSELYSRLPEVGDLNKPRLALFFDEAHLLFRDCPPPLLQEIERTIRLFRSKGVAVFFISQSKQDVPALIREQLATTIEHGKGIGWATLTTLAPNGNTTPPKDIRVDLPKCPLGAIRRPVEAVHVPAAPEYPRSFRPWRTAVGLSVLTILFPTGWRVVSSFYTDGSIPIWSLITAAVCIFALSRLDQ